MNSDDLNKIIREREKRDLELAEQKKAIEESNRLNYLSSITFERDITVIKKQIARKVDAFKQYPVVIADFIDDAPGEYSLVLEEYKMNAIRQKIESDSNDTINVQCLYQPHLRFLIRWKLEKK